MQKSSKAKRAEVQEKMMRCASPRLIAPKHRIRDHRDIHRVECCQ